MPEGDTIFRAARALNRALEGKQVTRFESALPQLNRIDEDSPLRGRTIESIQARGKWMTMRFSGDLILLTHMLMNGSWHIYRKGERWKSSSRDMRILIEADDIQAVGFRVPVAEFHTEASLAKHPGYSKLGEDILAEDFDATHAQELLASRPELEVADALLNQRLLAGAGNVYKSEICFACKVHPRRKVADLTTDERSCLIATAQKYLKANVADTSGDKMITYTGFRRTTGRASAADRLWVYGRAGQPCRRCATRIQRIRQGPGARVTFFCPNCQK